MIDSLTVIIRGRASGKVILPKGSKFVPTGEEVPTAFETRATFRTVKELREYLEQLIEELHE